MKGQDAPGRVEFPFTTRLTTILQQVNEPDREWVYHLKPCSVPFYGRRSP